MNQFDLYQSRVENSYKISKSRLADNKVKTFARALNRSYNAEMVQMDGKEFKALISGIPTSPQIEKKNFSTLKEHDCKVGNELYWEENDSHWLITEHDSTETSIFQGSVQHAIYDLKWKDPVTGKIYRSRACAKGPDETTISDGVKHSIMFDRLTDSLYLIIPSQAEGSELLRRYFELMVNGKKWRIEVLNSITHPDLLYLQLMETPINRDTDTEDLVDGKVPNNFEVISALDGLLETELNQIVNHKPMLFKDGQLLKDEGYTIRTSNCVSEDDTILFNRMGKAVVRVTFDRLELTFSWTINVVESSILENIHKDIVGSSNIKSMTKNEYVFTHTINSIEQDAIGTWTYDEDYFTLVEQSSKKIVLQSKNKTGTTKIEYESDETIEKEIKITPLFGGS